MKKQEELKRKRKQKQEQEEQVKQAQAAEQPAEGPPQEINENSIRSIFAKTGFSGQRYCEERKGSFE